MKHWRGSIIAGLSRTMFLCLSIALVFHFGLSTPVLGKPLPDEPTTDSTADYVPGELLVKLENGTTSFRDASRLLSIQQLSAASPVPELDIWKLKVPDGEELQQVEKLRQTSGVVYAELNYIAHAQDIPDDPYYGNQWGLEKIDSPEGWEVTHGDDSVIIAIVDTGIDGTHPDLQAKTIAGYNFVSSAPISAQSNSDDHYHGTHVAGIAAAVTNNGTGIAGLAWEARLMPVKVLSSSGSGSYENVALGIRYAADNGARVLNMSLGGSDNSQTLSDAVDYAYGKGCLLLAASGNQGASTLLYPARYANVMGVGRTDQNDNRYSSSNYGEGLSVMAPGSSIYSTLPGNSYGYLSGTSMSCPFASGLAALVWGVDPGESNEKVRQLLQDNAVDLGNPGWDIYYGYGRIDAWATLQYYRKLQASPAQIAFLADDYTDPIPDKFDIEIWPEIANETAISWTVTISPDTALWITVDPITGTIASQGSGTIQVQAQKNGLTYGKYSCEIVLSPYAETGTITSSVEVNLYYIRELSRTLLLPVLKEFAYQD